MKLKPLMDMEEISETSEGTISNINESFTPNEIAAQAVLVDAGIVPHIHDSPNEQFKKILNSKGGSLEAIASQVVNIMNRGETDAARLRAAEFIAKIQEIKVELDEKPAPKDVTINIIGQGSQNLIQFLMPKT
jgi:hypothetical protein